MMLNIGQNAFRNVAYMRGTIRALEAIADMVGELELELEILRECWSAGKPFDIWDIS